MPNLMQRGATWLGDRLKEAAGREVMIRRRGTIIGSGLTAWVAFQQYQIVEEDGVITTSPVWDWTFKTTDLGGVTLQDGDRIAETLNDTAVQYEVLPIGDMNSVTPLDSSGNLTLVHTKKVA